MKIPQAVAIRVIGREGGGVTLVLIDAQSQPIGEANLQCDAACSVVDNMTTHIDNYIDSIDSIGPCAGAC